MIFSMSTILAGIALVFVLVVLKKPSSSYHKTALG